MPDFERFLRAASKSPKTVGIYRTLFGVLTARSTTTRAERELASYRPGPRVVTLASALGQLGPVPVIGGVGHWVDRFYDIHVQ